MYDTANKYETHLEDSKVNIPLTKHYAEKCVARYVFPKFNFASQEKSPHVYIRVLGFSIHLVVKCRRYC